MAKEYKPFGQMENLSKLPESVEPPVVTSPNMFQLKHLLSFVPFYHILYPSATSEITNSSWFKWYYIVPVVFLACYIIALAESYSESIRNRQQEGMHNRKVIPARENDAKIKGILKKMDNADRHLHFNKRVSFYRNQLFDGPNSWQTYLMSGFSDAMHLGWNQLFILYEWWVLPWIYVVLRTLRFSK